jgi:hypothetical protein
MTRVALAARTGDSSWRNSDIAWQSPSGDAVAVFAGHGGQGMGSSLAHHVARALGTPPASSARERAAWIVRQAHEDATAAMDPAFGTFGTMASLAWDDDGVAAAHAGDSRVYRLRPLLREIECLTHDDVAGDTEPMNRMLVNAVGGLEDVRIHERSVACMPDDVLVCCTSRVAQPRGRPAPVDRRALACRRVRGDRPARRRARAERRQRRRARVLVANRGRVCSIRLAPESLVVRDDNRGAKQHRVEAARALRAAPGWLACRRRRQHLRREGPVRPLPHASAPS